MMVAFSLVGSAFAQEIDIEPSASDHENRFFGEGVLRVVVTDPDASHGNDIEEISIEVTGAPDGAGESTINIIAPETNAGSGRFEFFMVHVDATAVGPDDLDPMNTAGVEGDGICIADCAPFVTFGPGGDLDIDTNLYEDTRFEIQTSNTEAVVNYEETLGSIELDREAYGATSFVYILVSDQDANLNPDQQDEFTVDPDNSPNDDLLGLDGGTFDDIIVFRETGDNTAIFEGRYRLGVSILAESEALVLSLHEKANYGASLSDPANNSNGIDEVNFVIGNGDGTVNVGGGQQTIPAWDAVIEADKDSYQLGDTVHIMITDPDANVRSALVDSIELQISSGTNNANVTALETGADTSIFEAAILLDDSDETNAIIPSGFATITYTDKMPADYSEKINVGANPEKEFVLEIDVELPIRTGIDATDVTVPVITSVAGNSSFTNGTSLTLSTSLANRNEESQPFVIFIEVRDDRGVTIFLALQSGTLEPNGSTEIGALWLPDKPGTFEIRTFAINESNETSEPLSKVVEAEITVSQIQ